MNSVVRPIINEKVVKYMGLINSTQVHCSRENWLTTATKTPKKKKKKVENTLELKM